MLKVKLSNSRYKYNTMVQLQHDKAKCAICLRYYMDITH